MAPKAHIPTLVIDSDIVLDVLENREAAVAGSAGLLSLVEAGYARALMSALEVVVIHDELHKRLPAGKARSIMQEVLGFVDVAAVNEEVINSALALGWTASAPAITAAIARIQKGDHVITRDLNAYRSLQVGTSTPEEYIARHGTSAATI